MNQTLKAALFSAGIIAGIGFFAPAGAVTLDDLEKKLVQQEEEIKALRDELAQLKVAQTVQTQTIQQQTAVIENTVNANAENREALSATTVSSYGEIVYTRPLNSTKDTQVDVARAVIAMSHRFDSQTKMVSEFEWEHAVTSDEDSGESEVEQLYIEHLLDNGLRVKGGLFLMPVGLLNTSHEPTSYYGVKRNFVETAIIPTTWREVGVGISGTTANSLTWDAGLTTGFNLSKWDPTAQEGRDSPLASVHQEGQLARASNLSVYGALNWQDVPGLLLGASIFTGQAGQNTPGSLLNESSITMFDVHGRYQAGNWDTTALFARGSISHTADYNATIAGQPTPIPSSFEGGYVQVAYRIWKSPQYALSTFVRAERFNTAKTFSSESFDSYIKPDTQVATVGLNLKVGEGVVLKADYQNFKNNSAEDRLNLGLGYSF